MAAQRACCSARRWLINGREMAHRLDCWPFARGAEGNTRPDGDVSGVRMTSSTRTPNAAAGERSPSAGTWRQQPRLGNMQLPVPVLGRAKEPDDGSSCCCGDRLRSASTSQIPPTTRPLVAEPSSRQALTPYPSDFVIATKSRADPSRGNRASGFPTAVRPRPTRGEAESTPQPRGSTGGSICCSFIRTTKVVARDQVGALKIGRTKQGPPHRAERGVTVCPDPMPREDRTDSSPVQNRYNLADQ